MHSTKFSRLLVMVSAGAAVFTGDHVAGAERFDCLVRADFFAGFGGDRAAFDRAKKTCEDALARKPKHAEASVWHGSRTFFLSGQAFQKGDFAKGGELVGARPRRLSTKPSSTASRPLPWSFRGKELAEARALKMAAEARLVPLHQELKITTDYLEIEKARFGDRLRFSIESPTELGRAGDSADVGPDSGRKYVKYAVAPRRAGAEIRVCARAAGDQVAIEVSDDGPGFARHQMLPGHGLDLVESRLAAIFGSEACLKIAAANG